MSRFSGRRRSRQHGSVAEDTPPAPWPAPSQAPAGIDPLLTGRPAPDSETDEVGDDDGFDDDSESWSDWADESGFGERSDLDRVLRPASIDHDDSMALTRRARQTKVFDHTEEDGDDLDPIPDVPLVPLPASFRAVPESWSARRRTTQGAAGLPDAETVEESPRRTVSRPYRLDPFAFDPSSILVGRLGWYIDGVDVGAGPGFEALVFTVGNRSDVGVQLIVPASVDAWTFDSAVLGLEDVHVRSLGESDTAVGFDADGDTVCVSLRQHLDVYAVRLKGSNQFTVAVEIADRYAQVIDDEL